MWTDTPARVPAIPDFSTAICRMSVDLDGIGVIVQRRCSLVCEVTRGCYTKEHGCERFDTAVVGWKSMRVRLPHFTMPSITRAGAFVWPIIPRLIRSLSLMSLMAMAGLPPGPSVVNRGVSRRLHR